MIVVVTEVAELLHVYVFAPEAVSVILAPRHKELAPAMDKVGKGYNPTNTVAEPVPQIFWLVTVYTEAELGINGHPSVTPPDQVNVEAPLADKVTGWPGQIELALALMESEGLVPAVITKVLV